MLEFTKADVFRGTNLARMTIDKIWKKSEKNRIIIPTKTVGNAKLFKLNSENSFVKLLLDLDNNLIEMEKNSAKAATKHLNIIT